MVSFYYENRLDWLDSCYVVFKTKSVTLRNASNRNVDCSKRWYPILASNENLPLPVTDTSNWIKILCTRGRNLPVFSIRVTFFCLMKHCYPDQVMFPGKVHHLLWLGQILAGVACYKTCRGRYLVTGISSILYH